MEQKLCFVRKEYFLANKSFVKILDTGNVNKQSRRIHLSILVEVENNRFCIPLRNNLGDEIRKYGRIGHSVPSATRVRAGLDYRYALVVNDDKYIESLMFSKIPKTQYVKISDDYELIREEFSFYLKGFVRAARKGRVAKEPLYRESSLVNFYKELGIDKM